MFGKKPCVNALELRKRLLIAESEINRVQLIENWQTMAEDVRGLAAGVKSISSLASVAAMLVTGVSALRRSKSASTTAKPSWLQSALKGARLAGSLWLAFRARQG